MHVESDLERSVLHEMMRDSALTFEARLSEVVIFGTEDVLEAYAYWADAPVAGLRQRYLDDDIDHATFEAALERVFVANPSLVDDV